MFYQREHIEANTSQKIQSMTTALAIKCSEGIVLASDSQGSTEKIKSSVKKIHKINGNMGLVGAGDYTQIMDLVNVIIKKNYTESNNLLTDLNNCLLQLHEEKNIPHLKTVTQILDNQFPFTPEFLIGAIVKNKYHIYHGVFTEIGKYKCKTSDIFEKLEPYETTGSGGSYASLLLKQQNRLYSSIGMNLSQLSIEINAGIACYIIDEVKNFDLHTGGDTQIAIINCDGYEEISNDKQTVFYNKMIDNLLNTLSMRLTDDRTNKETLKKILPVSKATQL
jgi:20S proteasome alpha/beta subunit